MVVYLDLGGPRFIPRSFFRSPPRSGRRGVGGPILNSLRNASSPNRAGDWRRRAAIGGIRSAIINVRAVATRERYDKGTYVVHLRNGTKIISSRYYQPALRASTDGLIASADLRLTAAMSRARVRLAPRESTKRHRTMLVQLWPQALRGACTLRRARGRLAVRALVLLPTPPSAVSNSAPGASARMICVSPDVFPRRMIPS